MTRYTIIIEKGIGNYSAYCPDLPGVAAAGDTEEETVELMKEAIEFHMEGLREEKLPIPEPTVTARSIKVSAWLHPCHPLSSWLAGISTTNSHPRARPTASGTTRTPGSPGVRASGHFGSIGFPLTALPSCIAAAQPEPQNSEHPRASWQCLL